MRQLLTFLFAALLLPSLLGGCASENLEDLSNAPITPPCDSTAVATYTAVIRPVLERNFCLSCHVTGGDAGAVASFNFDTVTGLKAAVDAGKLLPSIEHTGPSPMPKNAPKMSDCDIARIKQWVRRGAPAD